MNRPLSLIIGVILLTLGCYMQAATHTRQETRYREEISYREELKLKLVEPTKGRHAAIGGGVGAVLGGGAAATLGGIGVVVAGTGVGLPAGAILIGTAALLGGAAGATIGATTGSTATYEVYKAEVPYKTQVPVMIQVVEKSYPRNMGLVVGGLGLLILVWMAGSFLVGRNRHGSGPAA